MYGAAVLDWPDWRQQEAFEDLDGVLAWNLLQGGEYFQTLRAEGLYDSYFLATRHRERAREMALVRATSRQCRGMDP